MDLVTSYASDIHRTLPSSHEAEQGVLCSCLLDPRLIDEVAGRVTGEHFFNPGHRTLWKNMQELWTKSHTVDMITLVGHLQDKHELESVGGAAYICELQSVIPTTANLNYYLEILSEKFRLREVIRVCTKGVTDCYERQDEVDAVIALVESEICAVAESRNSSKVSDPTDRGKIMNYLGRLEERSMLAIKGIIQGVPTGLRTLDRASGGLRKRKMYVIGGRPFSGKSLLLSQIPVHAARTQKPGGGYYKSLIFSLEMDEDEYWDRIFSQDLVAPAGAMSTGLLSDDSHSRLMKSVHHLRDHIFVEGEGAMTASDIATKIQIALKSHPDIDLICIDYLQEIIPEVKRGANTTDEVKQVTQSVNRMKKRFNLPILTAAAVKRWEGGGKAPRPVMQDLKGSSQIESDADGILFVHMDQDDTQEYRKGEFILAKWRGSRCMDISVEMVRKNLRFQEPEYHS